MEQYSVEKFLTLSSKDSPNYYPGNKPNDFSVKLHEKISLPFGSYRVGLVSISCQRASKLFDPSVEDDIAEVISEVTEPLETYFVEKKSASLRDALKEFNRSQSTVEILLLDDDTVTIDVLEDDKKNKNRKKLAKGSQPVRKSVLQRIAHRKSSYLPSYISKGKYGQKISSLRVSLRRGRKSKKGQGF